jgi:hypothetical protein
VTSITPNVPNIPSPDPSIITTERQAEVVDILNRRIDSVRDEIRGWVDALEILHEKAIFSGDNLLAEKIKGAEDKTANLDRVVQTRLAGSETALNAAMAAADKVTQEIKLNIGAVLNELKAGMTKQIESLNEKVEDLKKRVFESGGRTEGGGTRTTMIIATIAGIATVISALSAIVSVSVLLSRPSVEHTEPRQPAVTGHGWS